MFRAAASVDRAPAPVQVLPGLNSLVKLTVRGSDDPQGPVLAADVPTRIEDLWPDLAAGAGERRAELVWVAVPRYHGDVEVPEPGTCCQLAWPTPVGLFELPAAFEGLERVGPALRPAARVVWTRPCRTPLGCFAETGIAFADPEEHGDLLRRVVFTEQLRSRRAGLA